MAKFDKQAYLLSYFDEISDMAINSKPYNYVYCLNTTTDYSFPTTIANLTNRSELEPFVKLKTHQYNSLIPKIRLYRIDYDNQKDIIAQKQFTFKKDAQYTISNMLGSNTIKKNNCGIKSINWKLAGSNPVSAEKQIEVEIQMYFDSINAFSGGSYDSMISAWTSIKKTEDQPFKQDSFEFCEFETTTTNYWSLLFHPQTDKNSYDTFRFRIKAEVGWEDIGENIRSQLGISSDTVDIIKKLNYTFFLNLVKHQFTFNEDGSLQVTANYIASFESTTHNQQFDILGDLKADLENLKTKTLTEIISQAGGENASDVLNQNAFGRSDLEKSLISLGIDPQLGDRLYGLKVQQLSGLSNLANALTNEDTLATLKECSEKLPSSLNNVIRSANTQTIEKQAQVYNAINNEVNRIVERASQFVIKKYYSAFIEKLFDKDKNRYFGVRVDSTQQTNWSNWYSGAAGQFKPNITFNQSNVLSPNDSVLQEIKDEINKNIQEDSDNMSELNKATEEIISDPSEEMVIVFTTFGSIIDTAYNLIEENIKNKSSTSGENVTGLLNELKRIKVILSNISDEDQIFKYNVTPNLDTSDKVKIRNIAFAPIEINILKSFLIENVIRPQKTSYTLYSFLKDALSTLVIAGVNSFGQRNNETDKYANISLGSSLITLGDGRLGSDALEDLTNSGSSIIEASKLRIDSLSPFYTVSELIHNQYFTYFLMYDKTLKDFKPKNDPIDDAKQNVYHYTYGQDYGLIKAINFTKIDQPYLKEAKAVGKKTFFLGQFREVYNADLTMIGNNIYYPGMMLYIRPSVETSIGGDTPGFSQITGIGGYYFVIQVESSITEDGYETKLKTIWQSDGYEPSAYSIGSQEKCIAYLKEIGLITDGENAKLDSFIKAIDNQTSKQALEEQNVLLEQELEDLQIKPTFSDLLTIGLEEFVEIAATITLSEEDRDNRSKRATDIENQIKQNNELINKK